MSSLPPWLSTALSSETYMSTVLRVLANRESKRDAARNASRLRVLGKSENASSNSRSLFASLLRRGKDASPNLVDHYAVAAGTHDDHQDRNRYMDITPYDRTRVTVHEGTVAQGTDRDGEWQGRYLNANWVLERCGHKWWIATQAPLKHTAHAFLSVMLQPTVSPPEVPSTAFPRISRVRTVVQLTRNIESGRKKADAYFPSEVGRSVIVPPEEGHRGPALKVTLLETKTIRDADCVQSTISIVPVLRPPRSVSKARETIALTGPDKEVNYEASVEETVIFKHLLYSSWPDHGVPEPEDRKSLLAFIHLVDRTNRDTSFCSFHSPATPDHKCTELDPDPPIMVGCSAGIGRTGSFIALSSLFRKYGFLPPAARPIPASAIHLSPLGPLPDDLKDDQVAQEIDSLREQRPSMVQRTEQVILIYEVLADAFSQSA